MVVQGDRLRRAGAGGGREPGGEVWVKKGGRGFRRTYRTVSKGIQEGGGWAVEQSWRQGKAGTAWECGKVPRGTQGGAGGSEQRLGCPKMFSNMREDAQEGVER